MPRRYLSPSLSRDLLFAEIASENRDAALFYLMLLPHSQDDCTIPTKDPAELRLMVCPGLEGVTRADVAGWLELLTNRKDGEGHSLLEYGTDGRLRYPPDSFYRHQTQIPTAKRSDYDPSIKEDQRIGSRESGQSAISSEQSLTSAKNNTTRDARGFTPSLTPSPSLSPTPSAASAPDLESLQRASDVLVPFVQRGYEPDRGNLEKAATTYPLVDLELEFRKLADWLRDPKNRKESCSWRRIFNWLQKADRDRVAAERDLAASSVSPRVPPTPKVWVPPDIPRTTAPPDILGRNGRVSV